jgi:hypothetical protein
MSEKERRRVVGDDSKALHLSSISFDRFVIIESQHYLGGESHSTSRHKCSNVILVPDPNFR